MSYPAGTLVRCVREHRVCARSRSGGFLFPKVPAGAVGTVLALDDPSIRWDGAPPTSEYDFVVDDWTSILVVRLGELAGPIEDDSADWEACGG